jgi:hypothetical protein
MTLGVLPRITVTLMGILFVQLLVVHIWMLYFLLHCNHYRATKYTELLGASIYAGIRTEVSISSHKTPFSFGRTQRYPVLTLSYEALHKCVLLRYDGRYYEERSSTRVCQENGHIVCTIKSTIVKKFNFTMLRCV